jgi:hypothetical protein
MSAANMTELKRGLGLWGATDVGVGAIIGAGIFVLSGVAAGLAGPSVILSFVLAGLTAFLTALSSRSCPRSSPRPWLFLIHREGLRASVGFSLVGRTNILRYNVGGGRGGHRSPRTSAPQAGFTDSCTSPRGRRPGPSPSCS